MTTGGINITKDKNVNITEDKIFLQQSRTTEASSVGTDDEEEDEDPEKRLYNGLEGTSRGMVKGPIFIKFFQTGTNLYMALTVLFLFVITQFIVSLNDYFIPFL